MSLNDVAAEKAVLAGLYKYGFDQYVDIVDVIQQTSTFTVRENQILYSCFQHIFEKLDIKIPDVASLYSAARDIGVDHVLKNRDCKNHIEQIISFNIRKDNIRRMAGKLRKLCVARMIEGQLEKAVDDIQNIKGTESMSEILGVAENPVFDLSNLLNDKNEDPTNLYEIVEEFLEERRQNPIDSVGVSTGFPLWDNAIGGGLRPGTVNVIGARMKGFKSALALTMGRHVANLDIPVLYVDTEMQDKEQVPRLIASQAKVMYNEIETGKFANSIENEKRLKKMVESSRGKRLDHKNVAGNRFEDQLAVMRRWLHKVPKVRPDGKANPSLIIYDYVKLTEASGLQELREYQLIGFMMTTLHNFSVRYDIPILTFVQLNRDGIDREDTAIVSQSDRILWFCSNFSIFKPKTPEEREIDQAGNFKIVPKALRHGPGLSFGDYINVKVDGSTFTLEETKLKSEAILESTEVDKDGLESVNL